MTKNTVDGFVRWITPVAGDPTYCLLKAHLLFEELLRAYLARMLPHASALEGARLSFSQLVSLARASSIHFSPEDWTWRAILELNKLRNMLAHETQPKDLAKRLESYIEMIIGGTGVPLPTQPDRVATDAITDASYRYSTVDMVTVGLYYHAAAGLGFNVESMFDQEEEKCRALGSLLVGPAPSLPRRP